MYLIVYHKEKVTKEEKGQQRRRISVILPWGCGPWSWEGNSKNGLVWPYHLWNNCLNCLSSFGNVLWKRLGWEDMPHFDHWLDFCGLSVWTIVTDVSRFLGKLLFGFSSWSSQFMGLLKFLPEIWILKERRC